MCFSLGQHIFNDITFFSEEYRKKYLKNQKRKNSMHSKRHL